MVRRFLAEGKMTILRQGRMLVAHAAQPPLPAPLVQLPRQRPSGACRGDWGAARLD